MMQSDDQDRRIGEQVAAEAASDAEKVVYRPNRHERRRAAALARQEERDKRRKESEVG